MIWKATVATWIKCTNTKREVVYVNLDNAVTVTRNETMSPSGGTVIKFTIDQAAGAAQDFYGQAKRRPRCCPGGALRRHRY